MTLLAYIAIILSGIGIIYGPFQIGKLRSDKYEASSYVSALFECPTITLLAGRVLGWW
jgi:hypothetical protein